MQIFVIFTTLSDKYSSGNLLQCFADYDLLSLTMTRTVLSLYLFLRSNQQTLENNIFFAHLTSASNDVIY